MDESAETRPVANYYDATSESVLLFLTVAVLVLAGAAVRHVRILYKRIASQDRVIAELTTRVFALEQQQPGPERSEPVAESLPAVPVSPVQPWSVATGGRLPAPSAAAEDWETLLGTNWLNRLGAAVLVIGFALFLAYSLTQLGPSGKVIIGIAAGASLLAGGVAAARFDAYRNYSYSMMGAGWALVFFTAYAAHALPEARIIESAVAGAVLLLAVTVLMIAHSVCYRSETATALACLLGFVGLNVTPLTGASVIATLLLGASLTGLSWRFRWTRLPLLGAALTYLTFVLRYDISVFGRSGLVNGLATLWTYWLVFEVYDLLTLRRNPGGRSLFLINACGFTGASLLHEWNMKAADWSLFFLLAALAYLASSLLRARLTDSGEDAGYEWAATASTALMAAALIERFSGVAIATALLVEGQMVVMIGAWLGSRWIQTVGAVVLGLSCFRLMAIDAPGAVSARTWTPTGCLMSAAFFANRWFIPGAWYLTVAAGLVAMAVVNAEAPDLWVAPIWAAGGVLAMAARRAEWPWLGLAVIAAAATRAAIVNSDEDVLTTAVVVGAAWAGQLLWKSRPPWIRAVLSATGTALLTLLIAERVQGRLLTVWFGAEGASLLAAGFVLNERPFRVAALGLFLLCIGKLFLHDLRELDRLSRILSFLVLGVLLMAASWVYTRYREKLRKLL